MKTLILVLFVLVSFASFAGDPPVSLKGQAGSKMAPKWNLHVPNQQATSLGGIDALIETGNENILANPGFEHSTATTSWTVSNGTASADTTTNLAGAKGLSISLSAVNGNVIEQSVSCSKFANQNMEASLWVNTTATTVQACALADGTENNCSTVDSTGVWRQATLNFPAGASTCGVRLKTTSSTTATVKVDQAYVGLARNIISASAITDWKDFPSVAAGTLITATTTNPTYGTVSENVAKYRYIGDSVSIRWTFKQSTVGTAGSGNYLFNIPSSICVIDTAKTGTNSSARNQQSIWGSIKIVSGTTAVGFGSAHVYSSSQVYFEVGYVDSSNNQSAGPWGTTFTLANAMSVGVEITVPCQGRSSNVSAAKADQTNYGWTSYTPTLQGFGTTSNMDCWHKRDAGDILLDCKFLAGTSSGVEARVGLPGSLQTASSTRIPTIRSAGTWFKGGAADDNHGGSVLITSAKTYVNFSSSYTFASAGSSVDSLAAATDTGMGAGSRSISFTARIPIEGWTENQKAPVLVGSVTSNASGAERIERASVANSGTPTISKQSGSWVSSLTDNGVGDTTINFSSTMFSDVPSCTCNAIQNVASPFILCTFKTISTSSARLFTAVSTTGAASDIDFNVSCIGPR